MSKTTPIPDEQLLERLRRADPLAGAPPIGPSQTAAALARLLAAASAGDEAATARARRRNGFMHLPQRPSRRLALGAGAAVVAAGLVLGLGLPGGSGGTGAGTANAYADWTADPTEPAPGQVKAAEAACEGERPYPGEPSFAGVAPTVTDARGPWTLLVYLEGRAIRDCVVNPAGVASHGGSEGAPTVAVPPGAITLRNRSDGDGFAGEDQSYSEMDGEVGAEVTAAALVLEDGTKVQTSIANGWFAAWWPGESRVTSAEVTTASGTVTEQFPRLQHSYQLMRERGEQLEAAKREVEQAQAKGEAPAPAAPNAPAGSELASAEEACVAREDQVPVGGVPYGSWRALVAYTQSSFTLVLLQPSTQSALATCMSSPSGAFVGGLSSGYRDGKPSSAPPAQIRLEGVGFRGAGGGTGGSDATSEGPAPYSEAYGPVGSGVTAVTLILRDGEPVTPAIDNGWFIAWWPGKESVASAEVTTSEGTTTQQIYDPVP